VCSLTQNLLRLYQSKIDSIAVAAVLCKVGRVYRYKTPPADRPALTATMKQLFTWLHPFMLFQARYASVQVLSTLLWSWASLPYALRRLLPADSASRLLARACRYNDPQGFHRGHKLRLVAPKHLALLAWSAARIIPEGEASRGKETVQRSADAIVQCARRRITHFSPQGLSLLASGMVALSPEQVGCLLICTQPHAVPALLSPSFTNV
jgi:hypothetical protein